MSAALHSPDAPCGISFSPADHQNVSRHWKAWRPLGISVLIAGDHENYEEIIEVYPFGAGTNARWHIYMEPAGRVCAVDLNEATGDPLTFGALDMALTFIGAEIEADALDRAGADPCGCPI
jgi:hypothetical protein